MWLSRLDLLAFGKFTGVRLNLGPGFHLIYGPNEAGKSTTLRAIRQFLFGFDERTDDNFRHSNPNLRIGGVLSSHPDLELGAIRRKTRKDSLRGEDDATVIDPQQWDRFLCGVDEATFCQRYGIDYEQLVKGGHQIATGNGDLGEILFATGSGVMDLNAVKTKLTDEADQIFKPLGRKQRLNQAIVKWQELKEQVRDKLLSVSVWEDADRLRQETLKELDRVFSSLTRLTQDHDQYLRWKQAWPLVQELDALELSLREVGSVPRLRPDFAAKRQEAFLLLEQSRTFENLAKQAFAQSQQVLETLAEPHTWTAKTDELTKLVTEWGSVQKGLRDRVSLTEQQNRHTSTIGDLLLQLNRSVDELPSKGIVHDRDFVTRLSLLGRKHAAMAQALADAQFHQERLTFQIEQAERTLANIPAERSLDEFRSLLRKVQSDGDVETRLSEAKQQLLMIRDDLRQQIVRLGIGDRSVDEIIQMPIPAPKVLTQSVAEFQSNHNERSMRRSRLLELEIEHRELDQRIETLRSEFQVPTEADLEAARTRRTEIWTEIRRNWKAESLPSDQLMDAFEMSLIKTDVIADRLRKEADRVAQLAEELVDLETNETRQHEVSIRLAELESIRIDLEQKWRSRWPSLNEKAPSPDEIQTWLTRREAIIQSEERARRHEHEVNTLSRIAQQNIESLSNLLRNVPRQESRHPETKTEDVLPPDRDGAEDCSFVGEAESGASLSRSDLRGDPIPQVDRSSLKELVCEAEETLRTEEAAQRFRHETFEILSKLTREVSESVDRVRNGQDELARWRSEWHLAMEVLRLPSDASPDAAATFVATFTELVNQQQQSEQLLERIAGIDADHQRFQIAFQSFCEEVAPDLANLDVAAAIASLQGRLRASQRQDAIRHEQTAKKNQAQIQLKQAVEYRNQGDRLLTELCAEANLVRSQPEHSAGDAIALTEATFQELDFVASRSQHRKVIEEKINRTHARLTELSGDSELVPFINHVRLQSIDGLTLRVQELEAEMNRIVAERDQLNRQLGGIEMKLGQMGGSAEAVDAEELRQQCLAQIRSDAEEYVRLKLAGSVLHVAIERYREKIRGPVLKIASGLFRELTIGSFEGLRVDEDDNHQPILVGIRSSDLEAIDVSGMSEGTCDQLYLALRLASLQVEAAPRSELPLIIDDILIQFDDARAMAALSVLMRMSQHRQVIFFTHHKHLLDLAGQHLKGDYSVHQLEA